MTTIKERFAALEARIEALEERNEEIMDWASHCIEDQEKEIIELKTRIDYDSDQIMEIWDILFEEEEEGEPEEDVVGWEEIPSCECRWCRAVRENEMTRTSLCDVYVDCEACPEFDVCFDAIMRDDIGDCPADCDEDCDECPEGIEIDECIRCGCDDEEECAACNEMEAIERYMLEVRLAGL
jgi:hypothetical protein